MMSFVEENIKSSIDEKIDIYLLPWELQNEICEYTDILTVLIEGTINMGTHFQYFNEFFHRFPGLFKFDHILTCVKGIGEKYDVYLEYLIPKYEGELSKELDNHLIFRMDDYMFNKVYKHIGNIAFYFKLCGVEKINKDLFHEAIRRFYDIYENHNLPAGYTMYSASQYPHIELRNNAVSRVFTKFIFQKPRKERLRLFDQYIYLVVEYGILPLYYYYIEDFHVDETQIVDYSEHTMEKIKFMHYVMNSLNRDTNIIDIPMKESISPIEDHQLEDLTRYKTSIMFWNCCDYTNRLLLENTICDRRYHSVIFLLNRGVKIVCESLIDLIIKNPDDSEEYDTVCNILQITNPNRVDEE